MVKKLQHGEIATIITIGALVILGVSSLISSIFLKNKVPTTPKAQVLGCTGCEGKRCVYYPPDSPKFLSGFCAKDPTTVNLCTEDNGYCIENPGPTPATSTKCPGKVDMDGACNDACCDPGIPASFEGGNCVVQNGFCQSGFSASPTKKVKRECRSNVCAWTYCTANDPDIAKCCDGDPNTTIPADAACLICKTDDECFAANPTPPASAGTQCFKLAADVKQEPDKVKNGVNFFVTLKVISVSQKEGHIWLKSNGNLTANGNILWANKTTSFDPQYTATPIFVPGNGRSTTMSYNVKIDECNTLGNEDNLSCLFSVDKGLNPYSSCGLTNPPAPNALPTSASRVTPVTGGLVGKSTLNCTVNGSLTLKKADYTDIQIAVRKGSQDARLTFSGGTDANLSKIKEATSFDTDPKSFPYTATVSYQYDSTLTLSPKDYSFYVYLDYGGKTHQSKDPVDCKTGSASYEIPNDLKGFITGSNIKYNPAPQAPQATVTPTPAPLPDKKQIKLQIQFSNECGLTNFGGAIVSLNNNADFAVDPKTFSSGNWVAGKYFINGQDLTIVKQNDKPSKSIFDLTVTGNFSTSADKNKYYEMTTKAQTFDYSKFKDGATFLNGEASITDCTAKGTTSGPNSGSNTVTGVPGALHLVPGTPGDFVPIDDFKIDVTKLRPNSNFTIKTGQRIIFYNGYGQGRPSGQDNFKIWWPADTNSTIKDDAGGNNLSLEPTQDTGPLLVTETTKYSIQSCNAGWFHYWGSCKVYANGSIIVPTPTPKP